MEAHVERCSLNGLQLRLHLAEKLVKKGLKNNAKVQRLVSHCSLDEDKPNNEEVVAGPGVIVHVAMTDIQEQSNFHQRCAFECVTGPCLKARSLQVRVVQELPATSADQRGEAVVPPHGLLENWHASARSSTTFLVCPCLSRVLESSDFQIAS